MSEIKVGLVGLGRMGKEYARILAHQVRHVELVAVCSISEDELAWARQELSITSTYSDYQELLSHPSLDAVFIVSSTDMHVEQMLQGLEAGLHVFCEKPLATSYDQCLSVSQRVKDYPNLTAVVGFVRRFDPSYRYAKEKIEQGAIGHPFWIRSQTIDKDNIADWMIQYATKSGGIFHDYNVHDIDLTRWLLGSEFQEVWSIGGAYKYPAFKDQSDADNVMSAGRLENGSMVVIDASRTAMVGHDTYTEIRGTLGSLRIGRPAQKNKVEIYDQHGARVEFLETFWDRFQSAFRLMIQDFIDCIKEGRKPAITIEDAARATLVAEAFTTSYREGRLVRL